MYKRYLPKTKLDKDLLFNFISFLILASSGVCINLLIAVTRGTEALGVFNQAFAIYLIFSQLAVAGLQFSTLRQISNNQESGSTACSELCSAIVLAIPLSTVVCIGTYFVSGVIGDILHSAEVKTSIEHMLVGLFLFPINKIMLMSVNGMRHMRAYAIFNSGRYVLILFSLALLIVTGAPGEKLTLAFAMSELLLFLGFVIYLTRHLFRNQLSLPTWQRVRNHFSYGTRAMFSGLLIELNTRVDVLMLGLFLSDSKVGLYSFAATLAEGFKQIPSILRWNIDPILGKMLHSNKLDDLRNFVKSTQKKYIPIFSLLCVVAIACYPIGLMILNLYEPFIESWGVFAILMIAVALSSLYSPFNGIILQGGRPGLQSINTALTILFNIGANFILIPIFGLVGAAASTAATFLLDAALIAYTSKRVFKISL